MTGQAKTWPLEAAWEAAGAVTAIAYGVDLAALAAPPRGRGPKPAEALIEPRKVALYLTVCLSGAPVAHVGRRLGLHKDTASTHCAFVRERCIDDERLGTRVEALLLAAELRLDRGGAAPTRPEDEATLLGLLLSLHAKLDRVLWTLARLGPAPCGGAHPTGSDEIAPHPTGVADHANVIRIEPKARASR